MFSTWELYSPERRGIIQPARPRKWSLSSTDPAMEHPGEGSAAKASFVRSLMAAKRQSGKTYGQIAEETGLTNVYVAQLLRRQAQLKPGTAPALKAALPQLTDEVIEEMMTPPMRSYDPNLIQEPSVYRFLTPKPLIHLLSRFP